jgi:peptidoglycan/xylan/chitin deacetylase (PgdA/CDA1 family)
VPRELQYAVSDGQPRTFVRFVKMLGSLVFYVGDAAWALLLRLLRISRPMPSVVLYYHAVRSDERQAFACQMDVLRRLATPVRINLDSPLDPKKRYIAVTFDDAFENIIENAVPELRARNIPAAIFVVTGVLGETAAWWPPGSQERTARISTAQELLQLPTDLITFGAHTHTHPVMTHIHEPEARLELTECRTRLESLLGRSVTTFSFPFGAFNENLVALCREAGYQRVFTTMPQNAFVHAGEFVTGRVKADPSDWRLEFYLKCVGAYRWLPWALHLKNKARANRWLGKMCYADRAALPGSAS